MKPGTWEEAADGRHDRILQPSWSQLTGPDLQEQNGVETCRHDRNSDREPAEQAALLGRSQSLSWLGAPLLAEAWLPAHRRFQPCFVLMPALSLAFLGFGD